MIEHVYEKVMNGGSEAGSGAGTPTGDSRGGHGPEGEEGSSMAEGQVSNLFVPWIFYVIFRWNSSVMTQCSTPIQTYERYC